jgi:peptidoglycan/xylan/chitin deacetylase (PgdA/CDA1 family)
MKLALTYDAEHPDMAGSDPGVLDYLLSELDNANVKATFFVQGRWASAFPDAARAIAKAGHLIGSHSHYHADMRLLDTPGIAADLKRAREAIKSATRVDPAPYFRFPFSFGIGDPDCARAVIDAGYTHFFWDIDSLDWDGAPARQIFKRVSKGARKREESIVLFHTWPEATAEATRQILEWGQDRGVQFVTVQKLAFDHSGFAPNLFADPSRPPFREIA